MQRPLCFIENSLLVLYIDPVSASMLPPKKSLGQNFLRDENVARNIIDSLNLRPDDVVVEIGPGQGALTKYLAAKCSRLVAIEVDERAVRLLQDTFAESIEVVHTDVLTVSLSTMFRKESRRLRVVGNIPYNITSEILFWMFDHHEIVEDATLMVQLEVARRFVAQTETKDYGILSVLLAYYTEPEFLFKVSRNSFFPRPEVDSAVVRLRFRENLQKCDRELLTAVVRSTFGKRRKTLRNGLRYMGFDSAHLDTVPFDLTKRPEELTLDEFLNLTELLTPYRGEIGKGAFDAGKARMRKKR
ncbi:MAG: 16S rRNA (adenine(1518)-N(6)/adenine(1519)-N(6))-dimethyltransferase RsmA [Ignavibacteriales bacterium]|nr:16S rRNA (adenine(1518)-N(6)/adenine(1519)-N(6))-dimethyltransferase RsmA [Ignavibacteriales bacterium]